MHKVVIIYFIISLICITPLKAHAVSAEEMAALEIEKTVLSDHEESDVEDLEDETDDEENKLIDLEVNAEALEENIADEIQEISNTNGISKVQQYYLETTDELDDNEQTPITNNSTPSATLQSEKTEAATSSSLVIPSASDSAQKAITITNDTRIHTQVKQESYSGTNNAHSSHSAQVTTATASAKALSVTEVNTSLVGNDTSYGVTNVTAPHSDLDLSAIEKKCQDTYSEVPETSIHNQASVANTLTLTANSGDNTIVAEQGTLQTGSSVTEAAISTSVNTSLVGNCWLYHVINIFSPTHSSITLPNDEQFLYSDQTTSDSGQLPSLQTENTINNTEHLSQEATTGSNTAQSVVTGEANTVTETTTIANTTMYGNSWLLIKITNPHYWKGMFLDQKYTSYTDNQSLYYWLSPKDQASFLSTASDRQKNVTVRNYADIATTASLSAVTGNNHVEGVEGDESAIHTGNAHSEIEVLNLINNTVVGSNWYFVLLNLFDEFEGDISIARPDLLTVAPKKAVAYPGDTLTFYVHVVNAGNSSAKDVIIKQRQPQWHTDDSKRTKTWDIATIHDQASVRIPISITVPGSTAAGKYTVSYTVTNSYTEHSIENNTSSLVITVQEPAAGGVQEVTYSLPVTPNYASNIPIQTYYSQLSQYRKPLAQHSPAVKGAEMPSEESSLTVPFPHPLQKAFCIKHWELCSAAGILVTVGPIKAIQRKRLIQ